MTKPENSNTCPIKIERYDSKRMDFIEGKPNIQRKNRINKI